MTACGQALVARLVEVNLGSESWPGCPAAQAPALEWLATRLPLPPADPIPADVCFSSEKFICEHCFSADLSPLLASALSDCELLSCFSLSVHMPAQTPLPMPESKLLWPASSIRAKIFSAHAVNPLVPLREPCSVINLSFAAPAACWLIRQLHASDSRLN